MLNNCWVKIYFTDLYMYINLYQTLYKVRINTVTALLTSKYILLKTVQRQNVKTYFFKYFSFLSWYKLHV